MKVQKYAKMMNYFTASYLHPTTVLLPNGDRVEVGGNERIHIVKKTRKAEAF